MKDLKPLSEVIGGITDRIFGDAPSKIAEIKIDWVVPMNGHDVLPAWSVASVGLNIYPVLSPNAPMVDIKQTYLFVIYDRHQMPLHGFVLRDVILSNYIDDIYYVPRLPANTIWLSSRDLRDIELDLSLIKPTEKQSFPVPDSGLPNFEEIEREPVGDTARRVVDPTRKEYLASGLDRFKDWGKQDLDPPVHTLLDTTHYDFLVPIRDGKVLPSAGLAYYKGRSIRVLQHGDPSPKHRGSYLFVQYDTNFQPMNGFVLSGVFLSEVMRRNHPLDSCPTPPVWIDHNEVEQINLAFCISAKLALHVLSVKDGVLLRTDPDILVEGITDRAVATVQPSVLGVSGGRSCVPVPVLMLDYSDPNRLRAFTAQDVDLSKLIVDNHLECKLNPDSVRTQYKDEIGVIGFVAEGIPFTEIFEDDYNLIYKTSIYPRPME